MHYRLLFRPPLIWITIAECILVVAMAALGWHLWQSSSTRAPASGMTALAPHANGQSDPGSRGRALRPPVSPSTSIPSPAAPPGPTPGIRTDAEFLSHQMAELNRVEAAFASLEWRMTNALVGAIQYYLNHVVLPSIEKTEQAGR